MNLYKISQTENCDYDTYDSAIVCAPTAQDAQRIHPQEDLTLVWDGATWRLPDGRDSNGTTTWVVPEQVQVELVGKAADNIPPGVVLTSFRAG